MFYIRNGIAYWSSLHWSQTTSDVNINEHHCRKDKIKMTKDLGKRERERVTQSMLKGVRLE